MPLQTHASLAKSRRLYLSGASRGGRCQASKLPPPYISGGYSIGPNFFEQVPSQSNRTGVAIKFSIGSRACSLSLILTLLPVPGTEVAKFRCGPKTTRSPGLPACLPSCLSLGHLFAKLTEKDASVPLIPGACGCFSPRINLMLCRPDLHLSGTGGSEVKHEAWRIMARERQYLLIRKPDYDRSVRMGRKTLACYSRGKMKRLYPTGAYRLAGEAARGRARNPVAVLRLSQGEKTSLSVSPYFDLQPILLPVPGLCFCQ